MDESHFEHAARLEQHMRDAALAVNRQSEQTAHRRPVDFDGSCAGCSEEVPPPRVALGYYNCVDCAAANELRGRLRT